MSKFAAACAASILLMQSVCAKSHSAEQIKQSFSEGPTSNIEGVNSFIRNSRTGVAKPRRTLRIEEGSISARLLTPLNSKLAGMGDDVQAVVVESSDAQSKKWLPPGAILHGVIETSRKNNYGRTDAFIAIRFYWADVNGERIELTAAPSNPEGKLVPSHYHKYTKKEVLRGVLMTATKIAVPAAIGTGGLSIAITTGAGAAIGFALAEKNEHIKGAIDGAWQGSGLSVLNPIVKKGKTLQLAEGTALSLKLAEPVVVPKFSKEDYETCIKVSGELLDSNDTAPKQITQLNTEAKILNQTSSTSEAISDPRADANLADAQRQLDQQNLAGALSVLEKAQEKYPSEPRVKSMREEVLKLITGAS